MAGFGAGRVSGGSVESAFAVHGMFCGGCAATVERGLRRAPGVEDVSVSFLSDSAVVRHDAAAVTRAELAGRLADLGYEARPLDGERDSRAAQNAFQRSHRIRLAIAVGFGMWVMMATVVRYATDLPGPAFAWWVGLVTGVLSLPVLTYSAWPFYRLGWRGLRGGVPGMESLILIAAVAAVAGSCIGLVRGGSTVWFEVPVMLVTFQLVARLSDFGTRRRAADAVRGMLDLSPERARRIDSAGAIESVPASALVAGDTIESRAGERLAADGRVLEGCALLDTALMSGESLPVAIGEGDEVLAGTLNLDGAFRLRVTAAGRDRVLDVLASTVGRALGRKSDLMRLVDRIAGLLVPTIALAALLAFGLALLAGVPVAQAFERALAVLVVSCPCALSLAVPLVVSATASSAARAGIVMRDPSAIEQARRIDTVLLDKTGTLTEGRLSVVRVVPAAGVASEAVLALAALAERGSNHPLAKAIERHARAAGEAPAGVGSGPEARAGSIGMDRVAHALAGTVRERHERAGAGVRLELGLERGLELDEGSRLLAGSARWLEEHGVVDAPAPVDAACSRVLIALDARAIGAIELADTPREDAASLLRSLRRRGLEPKLASGDTPGAVAAVASSLGLDWRAALDPDAKRAWVESLQAEGHRVAFAGDGLNDAPALAAADLGIATGGGSDLARSAAAMSVLHGGLDRVEVALVLARRASRVLRQNLAWALVYNAVLLPMAMFGLVHPVMAAFAMLASSFSVSLNSLRLVRRGGASARKRDAVELPGDARTRYREPFPDSAEGSP